MWIEAGAADIRGANWAQTPWTSVFVHTGTIPLDSNLDGGNHGSMGGGLEKWAELPQLEYPSVNEAIAELELVQHNVLKDLMIKF
jgi:hypothetical protein